MNMHMAKLKLLTLSFLMVIYTTETHGAAPIYPLVSYRCNPDADIIMLTNSLINSEEGASYKYSDEKGTYSPWDLVEISRKAEGTRIVRTKKIQYKSPLRRFHRLQA